MELRAIHDKGNDAMTLIMVGHIPYLRRYARALTQNATDADDLVQNCLMRAISKIDRFEEGTNLRAWLLAILHNDFVDGFRKKRRAREAYETTETLQKGMFTPANQFRRVQVTDVEKALAQLPAKQRSTLLLIALENLSYEEVARITEVPVGTVRSRLSRARHALIELVDGSTVEDRDLAQPLPSATLRGTSNDRRPLSRRHAPALPAAPEAPENYRSLTPLVA